ncbi:type I glyceraldehyde-3-phosphate dehydrogenase [Microbulbifer yueqingensis]|uniref:Glyceraldehyde-3-phosphate dehydrogenase n=1 Tax=Microbulbifer yueqingensis TaxID=658219 RepID=A0A1G8ZXA6_9GAMM|nr:type I glyceraldehyde-3-phosphate dehydrogenase [Microbulbifer yueqingensis]SDK18965.1 glyceraldehyde 3-phosphate dehydrogenase/glyceraldehyde-3-phosphate dehydrogenase (NAD(P)) [Microbulbifer yueqingensis]
MKKIAINGLGRIGRLILRRYLDGGYHKFVPVAINDPMPLENLIYLLKYDSVYGRLPCEISAEDDRLHLGDLSLAIYAEEDPAKLPWNSESVDAVLECSGRFTRRADAARHLEAGAGRVLISAPCADADITVVMGVNHTDFDRDRHFVISNASCTTNSLAPPLLVLDESFGIEQALVTTIHAYTGSQATVDSARRKKIQGRAAAVNIIPTSTGADAATVAVLPQMEGRLSALAVRVPVVNGSLTDISVQLRSPADRAAVNGALRSAAGGNLHNILGYTDDDLVSTDIIGDPHSSLIHGASTRVQGHLAKVQAWYDNEYGYVCRCLDLLEQVLL